MATASFSRVDWANDVQKNETSQSDPLEITPEQRESIQVLVIDDDRTLREGCASMLQMSRRSASFKVAVMKPGVSRDAARHRTGDCHERRTGDTLLAPLHDGPRYAVIMMTGT
jgi:hypothetical protein